jgi:hypothetical protein
MGIPEYEAKRFEGKVREGGILISVHTEDTDGAKAARAIFERIGARDISTTGEAGVSAKEAAAMSH